jgi:DNA-binding NarL/FixJ family response regulator
LPSDNYLVREGVGALLREVDGVELVATATNMPELLDAMAAHRPDVVLRIASCCVRL